MTALPFLTELERLAKTATPSTWAVDHDDRPGYEWNAHIVAADDHDHRICFMTSNGPAANAEYIAACHPQAILSLIEALRNIRSAMLSDEAVQAAENAHGGSQGACAMDWMRDAITAALDKAGVK